MSMESNKVHQEDLKRNQEGGPNGNERKPAACDHPSHHCLLEQPGGGAAVKLENTSKKHEPMNRTIKCQLVRGC